MTEPADLGPHTTDLEAILRITHAMSTGQTVALGEAGIRAARNKAELAAARRAVVEIDDARARAVVTRIATCSPRPFAAVRGHLNDTDDARLNHLAHSPGPMATVLTGSLAGVCAVLTTGGWLAGAEVGVQAATLALLALGALLGVPTWVTLRLCLEDRSMARSGIAAWTAMCDAALAVAARDLCEEGTPWSPQAYRSLTASWAAAVLEVPPPPR